MSDFGELSSLKDFVESDSKPSLEAEEFKEDSCPLKVKNYLLFHNFVVNF